MIFLPGLILAGIGTTYCVSVWALVAIVKLLNFIIAPFEFLVLKLERLVFTKKHNS